MRSATVVNLRAARPDHTVRLEQIPKWTEAEAQTPESTVRGGTPLPPEKFGDNFKDPLISPLVNGSDGSESKFPVDPEINSKLYLWRGEPWTLEIDAVVNSTNESLDEAFSSPGLHAAAGPGLAEECATLGGCRTGEVKITGAYNLPARKVLHTVGPRYSAKFHSAGENGLSRCYRSCLECLVECDLSSIAMGCIYAESKEYPREPAAHVAIRTVRRFLEKHGEKLTAVVFCTHSLADTEIYKRLLPLYFPRDDAEETAARSNLPADTGDENGETVFSDRKIRISVLPGPSASSSLASSLSSTPRLVLSQGVGPLPNFNRQLSLAARTEALEALVDPAFMMMMRDPDERRREQWERTAVQQQGPLISRIVGLRGIGGASLAPAEEEALHSRYLTRANVLTLSDIAEMKILYRGGVDSEGRQVMVVVGAHFRLPSMDVDRFVLYVIKEFEAVIQRPYVVVYFHTAAALTPQPNFGFMRRLQQIMGRKHRLNLQAIYALHPTFGLRVAVFAMQILIDPEVWKRVKFVESLSELFKHVPRDQLTIPDFVLQHDIELNPSTAALIMRSEQNRLRAIKA